MNIYLVFVFASIVIAAAIALFRAVKGMNSPLLALFIDFMVTKGVRAAEQAWKKDKTLDRMEIALEAIAALLAQYGISYAKYADTIPTLAEAAVNLLPKSNTSTEDPAESGVS